MLYDMRVDIFFDGVDPGPCSSQALKKCDVGQTCGKMQTRVETLCMFIKENYV